MHPSSTSSSFKKSATKATAHTSAFSASSVQLSDSSLPMNSKPSQDYRFSGQTKTDLYDIASEMVVVSSDLPALRGNMCDQQIPEGSQPIPSERQLSPSADHGRHLSPGSVPSIAWPVSPSLDPPPANSTGASQLTISPSTPVDLSVFDWNMIPNPLVETTRLTSTCHLPSNV